MPPESSTRPATRLPAPERREAILDAAELVFIRSGLRGTTTRDLAQACGVTEPVLYRHFPGKNELFIAVVTRMIDDAIAQLQQPTPMAQWDHAMQRALEAVLLAEDGPTATVIQERRHALESVIAAATGRDGPEELARRLGNLVLGRLDGD